MSVFSIQRWDAVLTSNSDYPIPMIYIVPDQKFLDYAEKNKYVFSGIIENTGGLYDDKEIVCICQSSGFFPDYRPNFFNDTKYYVIMLLCNWVGYPKIMGDIRLEGLVPAEGLKALTILPPAPFITPQPFEIFGSVEGFGETRKDYLYLGLLVFVILAVIYIIFSKLHNK